MSTGVRTLDLRLSFIWAETTLRLLDNPVPEVPFRFLGREVPFAARFDKLDDRGCSEFGLRTPWPARHGHRFWTFYLEGRDPLELRGRQAWRFLVPMRMKPKHAVRADGATRGLHRKVSAEAFFFPHGHALVVNVRLVAKEDAGINLFDMVDAARRIRVGGRLAIRGPDGTTARRTLEGFAREMLTFLRRTALADTPVPGNVTGTPFGVTTFVRVKGTDPGTAIPDGGDVHRALHGLSGWHATWRIDEVPALAEAAIPRAVGPESHVHYGQRRGRVIWFPGLAQRSGIKLHSLSCYHRNQALALLQVQSLCEFVRATAGRLRRGDNLSAAHDECARRAAGILGRLHGGDASTYRSSTCQAFIKQNNVIDSIDLVRDRYNMPPLETMPA